LHRWFISMLVLVCIFVWQAGCFAAGKEWSSEEKLSKLTKPAVVRVVAFYWGTWTIGNVRINAFHGGQGSGAIIHPDGYIVTNAHVVEAYTNNDKQRFQNLAIALINYLVQNYHLTQQQAISLITSGAAKLDKINNVFVVITPGGEQLPFYLKEVGSVTGDKDGKDVAVIKVEGRNLPTLTLGDSDKIRTGERIFVAGYPGDADLTKWGLGNQQSALEWSWAPGTISSDRKVSAQGAPLIQVNAEGVKPGNSGGPVLNAEGQVIGLLTFGTPGGPHWAMATKTVQEFVRKAGIGNEASLTDKAYREGLNYYWQGYYSKAIAKFEEVRRLYPKHSEVDGLLADCQNNVAQGNDKYYLPDYYPYFAAATLVLVAAAVLLIRRRKKLPGKNSQPQ